MGIHLVELVVLDVISPLANTLTLKDHYKNSFFTKTFDFVVE